MERERCCLCGKELVDPCFWTNEDDDKGRVQRWKWDICWICHEKDIEEAVEEANKRIERRIKELGDASEYSSDDYEEIVNDIIQEEMPLF